MQGLFVVCLLGPSLGLSALHDGALHCGLQWLHRGGKWSRPRGVWNSFRCPGMSSVMECLFPVSGWGSSVYSMMTDTHKMERRVSISSPATSQAGQSCRASANEAVQETPLDKVQL